MAQPRVDAAALERAAAGPTERPTRPSSGRLVWADVAKGACILLVVLHHLVSKHFVQVVPDDLPGAAAAWWHLTYALKPIRMPLFFLVSGIFAASALRRPWDRRQTVRLVGLYLLYAGWLVLHAGIFSVATELPMNRTRNGEELLADLVFASTGLWYLYALAVYGVLARWLHRLWGPWPTLLLAGAVAVGVPLLDIEGANRVSVVQHFVYFAVGAYLPTVGGRLAALSWRTTGALAAATVALAAGLWSTSMPLRSVNVLVSVLAVPCALRGAAAISRWRPVRRAASYVGRHSLPIYVLHVPLLAVLHRVVDGWPLPPLSNGWWIVPLAAYPVAAAVVLVLACLAVQRVGDRCGLGWVFRPRAVEPLVAAAHRLAARLRSPARRSRMGQG
ncbi:acyltransferase family protein [Nocardioides sp. SYSU DS0651]|uniref:acyltransferase family protein n=1 Tax=Nocardioides sp. SYSU DS0651 TaxID=3415955 RepID=UPI003F4B7F32